MQHWQQQGREPDYRFSLANERTFLAWLRTAFAVLAGAMLMHQFVTSLQPPWIVLAASAVLTISALLLSVGAYVRWRGNEIAMRHARPLPRTWLIPALATLAATLAGLTVILLILS